MAALRDRQNWSEGKFIFQFLTYFLNVGQCTTGLTSDTRITRKVSKTEEKEQITVTICSRSASLSEKALQPQLDLSGLCLLCALLIFVFQKDGWTVSEVRFALKRTP